MAVVNQVGNALTGSTGTGSFVGSVSPTFTGTPILSTASATSLTFTGTAEIIGLLNINDANGNELIGFEPVVPAAVNFVQILNNTTGSSPAISAVGDDTDLELQLSGKGTGGAIIEGTSTNNNATSGFVGEYISSSVLIGSQVSIPDANPVNVTSISLTAGDWDVAGTVYFNPDASTTSTVLQGAINTTSVTLPTTGSENNLSVSVDSFAGGNWDSQSIGQTRISLAATTTVYLIAQANFAVSTMFAYGFIGARRVR